jgi:glutamine synthetase
MSAQTTVVMPDAHGVVSLRELAAMHKVRFILAMFVDLAGKPCAKLVPAEAADEFQSEGVGFAGYAAGLLGQQPSDPDVIASRGSAGRSRRVSFSRRCWPRPRRVGCC